MNTDVIKAESFEEKMKARIKDGIGDLLGDEEIKKMIERSINDIFFIPKKQTNYPYNALPSLMEGIVKEAAEAAIRKHAAEIIDNWIKENPEYVKQALDKVVERGVGNAMISALNQYFGGSLELFRINVASTLQQNGLDTNLLQR